MNPIFAFNIPQRHKLKIIEISRISVKRDKIHILNWDKTDRWG